MELILVVVVVLIIIGLIVNRSSANKNKTANQAEQTGGRENPHRTSRPLYQTGELPSRLGLASEIPLAGMAQELETAFDRLFEPQLKRRVLVKYPHMTEAEFDWKTLELKRYFLMNAVMRGVPMFSDDVDHIWHEMLMFTREYETFCESWYGRIVHHAPHGEGAPMPGERAWFDWIYSQLFVPTPYSARIWRGFFHYPIGSKLIEDVERWTKEELASNLFNKVSDNAHHEVDRTIALLIGRLKDGDANARDISRNTAYGENEKVDPTYHSASALSNHSTYAMLGSSMLLFSIIDPLGYSEQMEQMLPEEEKRDQSSCGSSSCSGTSESDRSDSQDGSDSGDSSSCSSSSCSSSSCSSS